MFEQIPLTEKILRTVIVYALIAVLFRLTGKRGLANLNTFDFIVIFLLSNVVQNAVIGNDNSLLGGMIGAVTLVAMNVAVNRLIAINATAARIFEGRATTVISDGQILNLRYATSVCDAANSSMPCACKTPTTSARSNTEASIPAVNLCSPSRRPSRTPPKPISPSSPTACIASRTCSVQPDNEPVAHRRVLDDVTGKGPWVDERSPVSQRPTTGSPSKSSSPLTVTITPEMFNSVCL